MMIRLNYLILCFSPFLNAVFVPNAIQNWDDDKVGVLTHMVETFSKLSSRDITVVASQNVYTDNSTLEEIRTVELVIPISIYKKMDPEDHLETPNIDEDDAVDEIWKLQRYFWQIYEYAHRDLQVGVQKFSKSGDLEEEVYYTKDQFLVVNKGVAYYSKSNIIVSDPHKLANYYQYLFGNGLAVSSLFWDENRIFDHYKSYWIPRLLAHIDEASEYVKEDMMDNVLQALTFIILEYPVNIAKGVATVMSEKYPYYTWFVTQGQEKDVATANYDVCIKATYDNFYVWPHSLQYSVCGIKK